MKIQLTRKTGFYGMGSGIDVLVNGEKAANIAYEQTIELEVPPNAVLQVKFYFLKSLPYPVSHFDKNLHLKITMNLWTIQFFLIFYVLSFFAALASQNILFILGFLMVFFIFMPKFLKQAYVLKEEPNG